MNKKIIASVLASAFVVAAFAPSAATAADGTITFNGKIVPATCTVSSGSASQTVTLPTVDAHSLAASGQTAGLVNFTIDLTGCTGNGAAMVYFDGGSNTATDGNLKNLGGAGNVEVQLLNNDSTTIDLSQASGSQNSKPVSFSSGAATLPYQARYYATGASSAGSVTTSTAFTVVYQ